MNKFEEHKQRIQEFEEDNIFQDDSGYNVWWPSGYGGYLTSTDLRIIADLLDESNKEWDAHVAEAMNEK